MGRRPAAASGVRALVLAGAAFFLAGFGWLSQADAGSDYVTGLAPRC